LNSPLVAGRPFNCHGSKVSTPVVELGRTNLGISGVQKLRYSHFTDIFKGFAAPLTAIIDPLLTLLASRAVTAPTANSTWPYSDGRPGFPTWPFKHSASRVQRPIPRLFGMANFRTARSFVPDT